MKTILVLAVIYAFTGDLAHGQNPVLTPAEEGTIASPVEPQSDPASTGISEADSVVGGADISADTLHGGSSHMLRGLAIGVAIGGATGFIAGRVVDIASQKKGETYTYFSGNGPPTSSGSIPEYEETSYRIVLPIAGALVGGLVGALLGAASDGETSIP